MATEQPSWPIGDIAAPLPCSDHTADNLSNMLVQELLDENRRLKEIVVYLSGLIVRDVVKRE
jgi:hypothetical protein